MALNTSENFTIFSSQKIRLGNCLGLNIYNNKKYLEIFRIHHKDKRSLHTDSGNKTNMKSNCWQIQPKVRSGYVFTFCSTKPVDMRHCKHPQRPQSHSVELIFAPWFKKSFLDELWYPIDANHTAFRISKKIVVCNLSFSFRQRLVPKNDKNFAFLTEVKKGFLNFALI